MTRISLAECLHEAMASQRPMEDWYEAERSGTVEETVQTITNILEEYAPLVDLVAKRMPADPDPRTRCRPDQPDRRAVSGLPHLLACWSS